MLKRILSLCLIIVITITLLTTTITVNANDARYIVLLLEDCDTYNFYTGYTTLIYTAQSATNYVKTAAKNFVLNTLQSNSNQYIAVISQSNNTTITQCRFTNDPNTIFTAIDKLTGKGSGRNLTLGLEATHNLLNTVSGNKNVVVFTTGISDNGAYFDNGHYDNSVVGSNWHNRQTKIPYYKYANATHVIADRIKEYGTIYTVGLFQTMEGMPEEGKPAAEFFRLFVKDLATPPDKFYEVENPEDINIAFEEVAEQLSKTAYSFTADQYNGTANINNEQGTGTTFHFTAVTSDNVSEISVFGDKNNLGEDPHEIPYQFLKDNYKLNCVPNGDGTKTWTFAFGINRAGAERILTLAIDGQKTDQTITLNISEPVMEEKDTESPVIKDFYCEDGDEIWLDSIDGISLYSELEDDKEISSVQYYLNGNMIQGTNWIEKESYQRDRAYIEKSELVGLKEGTNKLTAIVWDSAHNTDEKTIYIDIFSESSESNEYEDNEAPVILDFYCEEGTTLNPNATDSITIVAKAKDNKELDHVIVELGYIGKVDKIYFDDNGIATKTYDIGFISFTKEGSLSVIAVDKAGNHSESKYFMYYLTETPRSSINEQHTYAYNHASNNNEIEVFVQYKKISFDVKPRLINDRTMVPLRAIFETLGARVDWDEATQTVTAYRGDVTIELTIGDSYMYVNGYSVYLDSPAVKIDDRTLVPVRAISESFGCEVEWYEDKELVSIAE